MRILVSQRADADLLQIDRYLSERNPVAAESFAIEINRKFQTLQDFPFIGRDRSALHKQMRSITIGVYVVFYKAERDRVTIVRVLHGHQDIDAEFQR